MSTAKIKAALEASVGKNVKIVEQDWYPAPSCDAVITYLVEGESEERTIICTPSVDGKSYSFC